MKFQSFLKMNRQKFKLTQNEIVSKLIFFHHEFEKLSIVSYGRWERGEVEPSSLKMFYVSLFFQIPIKKFLEEVELKLSETQKYEFSNWFNLINNWGKKMSLMGYDSSEKKYSICKFNSNNLLDTALGVYEVNKITSHGAKCLNVKKTSIPTPEFRKKWQISGNLVHHVLMTVGSRKIHAHATWSIHPQEDVAWFLQQLKNQCIDFDQMKIADKNEKKFLFIHTYMLYTQEWNEYILNQFLLQILDDDTIDSVIIATHVGDLAIKTLQVFNGSILQVLSNDNFSVPVNVRLLKFSRADFLAHHGVIEYIKTELI